MKLTVTFILIICFAYCDAQQKPASKDYTQVKISENGHQDSVIDNKPRLYNASIPEPCLKCVIQAIRRTDKVKPYVNSPDSSKIVYEIDWYSSDHSGTKTKKAGSGMLINVYKDMPKKRVTLAAYIYDNVKGQLSYIDSTNGNQSKNVKLDTLDKIKIRNACFWGVASQK